MTALDVIRSAFQELGVLGAAETLSGEDADLGLDRLNRILDNWNAERQTVYGDVFTAYTLTPNLTPHTIGPSGTFVVAQRPVAIDGASLILTTSTPDVYQPIVLRDRDWWNAQAVPGLTSAFPTDLFYDPSWPNGTLHFWPVPTVAYGVELVTRVVLAALTLATTFTLPPGYHDAAALTLAEALAPALKVPLDPQTKEGARIARARVFGNNRVPKGIATRDAGMPSDHGRGGFNYLTREMR